jgi:hypothetical protein
MTRLSFPPPLPDEHRFDGSPNPISLRDVLDLGVRVEPDEAIAVVEGLCERLATDYPDALNVPELPDIQITALGSVTIRRGAESEQGLDGLGRTLNALLNSEAAPVPLRLFAMHWVAAATSVNEFAAALAYYSRPDRDLLVKTLYARCLEAPAPALTFEPAIVRPLEPAPPAQPQVAKQEPRAGKRRLPRWVALAAALVLLAVSGYALFHFGGSDPRVQSSVSTLKTAVASVTASAAAVVRESLNIEIGRAELPPVEAAEPERPAARSPRRSQVVAALTSLSTVAAAAATAEAPLVAPSPIPEAPAERPPASLRPATEVVFENPLVYSAAAVDVQPPVLFSPKLPPVTPAKAHEPGTNTMELVIGETGLVEKVKLISRPARMPDMMLLSNAKTWQFHPATRQGRPVKYQLAFSWAATVP